MFQHKISPTLPIPCNDSTPLCWSSHQSTMRGKHEGSDGNHIPPHGPKGAGSKGSVASPEWQVVNRAKRKWASVWRPIATNAMSLEAATTDPMYTTELYRSRLERVNATGQRTVKRRPPRSSVRRSLTITSSTGTRLMITMQRDTHQSAWSKFGLQSDGRIESFPSFLL